MSVDHGWLFHSAEFDHGVQWGNLLVIRLYEVFP
jgi:hypothetical protein